MASRLPERMELAERWRQLGERLRKRSPRAFEKLLDVLAASAVPDEEGDDSEIDSIYPFH